MVYGMPSKPGFYRSGKSGFIPSPALGDPSDSRFDYPITQSKSKKKVID
jgi:hypothetical protein